MEACSGRLGSGLGFRRLWVFMESSHVGGIRLLNVSSME